MRYIPLFLFMILLSSTSSAFAERGGGGRDFNRGGNRDIQRNDFNRHNENWQHRDNWGGGNINVSPEVIIPQGQGYNNNNPFPDDAEQDQIYQEDLPN